MNLCFYPIIDAQFVRGEKAVKLAKAIIRGGAKIIQYRNKMDSDEVFEKEARKIMAVAVGAHCNAPLRIIINDRIEIAKKIGADGVHIGWEDIKTIFNFQFSIFNKIRNSNIEIRNKIQNPNFKYQNAVGAHCSAPLQNIRDYLGGKDKIIGVTARNAEEAIWAEKAGADYIGLSAVFATATKTDAPAMGLEGLKKIVKAVKIPTVAIGGINEKNIEEVLETGVTGAAMVSAVCLAENPEEAVRRLMFKAGANGGLPVQRSF